MKNNFVVIGAGGHCRSLISLLKTNNIEIKTIYDETYNKDRKEFIFEYPISGSLENVPEHADIILAIGNNKKRAELFNKFIKQIYKINVIHPSAILEQNIKIGVANQVYAKVYCNAYVEIGDNNVINTASILEHEVRIGDNNHISVNSILCGRVTIGNNCFIGAGAVINDKVIICDNVIIGSNSTVIHDISEPGIYAGQPIKKIK